MLNAHSRFCACFCLLRRRAGAGRLACLGRLFKSVTRRRAYINSLYAHVERDSTPNNGYLSVSVYGRLDLQQRRFDNFKPKAEESLDDFCE
jgi:hypothetical protein